MHIPARVLSVFLLLILLCSCHEGTVTPESVVNMLSLKDSSPPVLLSIQAEDERTACLQFDEDIFALEGSFPGMETVSKGNALYVDFGKEIDAGSKVEICGSVRDNCGNSVTFKVQVWGFNPTPAKLKINEFTTRGSKTQPDRTELKVVRPGNIAGMVLYDGIPGNFRSMYIFPSYNAGTGSFVTVWWCDELPSGVKTQEANNLNFAAGGGLSENNGIMCLSVSPAQGAAVSDCVIWSSGESSQFGGYGTKEVQDRVLFALEKMWWAGDPIFCGWSTSTRSMALNSSGLWYTTVQGGLTFGGENTAAAFSK